MIYPKHNPNAVPVEVVAIEDMGHGPGKERVTVGLFGVFTRYYALDELATEGTQGREGENSENTGI